MLAIYAWRTPWAVFGLIVFGFGPVVGVKLQGATAADGVQLAWDEAVQSGQIDVRFIVRDSTTANLIVANHTDRPLALELPEAFAGLPVLAQQQRPFGRDAKAPQAAQAVGLAFPRGGNQAGQGQPNGQNQGPFNGLFNNRLLENGLFQVPAGNTVKLKAPVVCLEFGKPDPRPRIEYQLYPLEEFNGDKRILAVLQRFSQGDLTQRVAQLATWHITDGLSWDELKTMQITHLNGSREKRFRSADIRQAAEIVRQIDQDRRLACQLPNRKRMS